MSNGPADYMAPEWARYKAMDRGGVWYWYQQKPTQWGDSWAAHGKMRQVPKADCFGSEGVLWNETLTKVQS